MKRPTEKEISLLLSNMEMKKCPICGCEKLWFKQYNQINDFTYNVMIKCDNCAYVNTTVSNISKIPYDLYPKSVSYEHIGVYVNTLGVGQTDKLIGYDYWIRDKKIIPRKIKCVECNSIAKIKTINPFIRYDNQYRVDIICTCDNCHHIAFGVHIDEDTYKTLARRSVGENIYEDDK